MHVVIDGRRGEHGDHAGLCFCRFLFDNQSPAHIYYRWKLFSILQVQVTMLHTVQTFHLLARYVHYPTIVMSPVVVHV